VSVQPTIEGALPEQRALLEGILAGLGSTRIESVFLSPYTPRFEDMHEPPPGDYGDAVTIEIDADDMRAVWDATLLANAFASGSKATGLRKVAWFSLPKQAGRLENAGDVIEPLGAEEIDSFRGELAEAAQTADVEHLDVLEPQGHAFAFAVRVEEPHAFLRFHGWDVLQAVERWTPRCDGVYAEIRDGEAEPALILARHRRGGFRRSRNEVSCCIPGMRRSLPGQPTAPPNCPVFGSAPRPLPHTSR
jgi:hypothetical protein